LTVWGPAERYVTSVEIVSSSRIFEPNTWREGPYSTALGFGSRLPGCFTGADTNRARPDFRPATRGQGPFNAEGVAGSLGGLHQVRTERNDLVAGDRRHR